MVYVRLFHFDMHSAARVWVKPPIGVVKTGFVKSGAPPVDGRSEHLILQFWVEIYSVSSEETVFPTATGHVRHQIL